MKKDFLPNLVIIVATTLLVVVIFYNIYVFVPSIQKTFGNLADWFMVVITAITAVFLYRTLKSQKEVQEDQAKINKLGMYDIRSKYLPRILNNQHQLAHTYYDVQGLRQVNFLVTDHNAIRVTIKSTLEFEPYFKAEIYQKDGYYCQDISRIPPNTKFPIRFDEKIVRNFLETKPANDKMVIDFIPYLEIAFEYHDNFGFKYFNCFRYEYQPFTEFLNIRESNIDFL